MAIKMLWNLIVPTKVDFFAWEVWWGKIMTIDQLKKRGFSLVSRCPLCGNDEESLEDVGHTLSKGLVHVDYHFLLVRRGLGMPLSGERPDARLAAPPLAEKGF